MTVVWTVNGGTRVREIAIFLGSRFGFIYRAGCNRFVTRGHARSKSSIVSVVAAEEHPTAVY